MPAPSRPRRRSAGRRSRRASRAAPSKSSCPGKKYVFRIANPVAIPPVLASVAVEARELLGLPAGMIQAIQSRMPLTQGITNVRVFPAIDSVRILFKTRQPTVPVVDIKQTDNQVVAGAAFPFFERHAHDARPRFPAGAEHELHVSHSRRAGRRRVIRRQVGRSVRPSSAPGRARPLSFSMTSSCTPMAIRVLSATAISRSTWGAGDIETQDMLGATQIVDEISGGDNVHVGQSVAIDPAPVGLWVRVVADEDDSVFTPFGHDPFVSFAPEGSTWTTYESDYGEGEVASITKWFDLSDAGPVPQEIPFTLETGPGGISTSRSTAGCGWKPSPAPTLRR